MAFGTVARQWLPEMFADETVNPPMCESIADNYVTKPGFCTQHRDGDKTMDADGNYPYFYDPATMNNAQQNKCHGNGDKDTCEDHTYETEFTCEFRDISASCWNSHGQCSFYGVRTDILVWAEGAGVALADIEFLTADAKACLNHEDENDCHSMRVDGADWTTEQICTSDRNRIDTDEYDDEFLQVNTHPRAAQPTLLTRRL